MEKLIVRPEVGLLTCAIVSMLTSGVIPARSAELLPRSSTSGPAAIIDRGPHHAVHAWETEHQWPDGSMTTMPHRVTEMASGMHYLKDGQWTLSKEIIEIFQDGAIARQGQHQVIFAPNINSEGAIDLLASDGVRFRSHILGLAYLDTVSGQSVLIATLKDSIGEVIGNQVIYRDAFNAPIHADVRYTYTRAGFEQDVILHEAPPSSEQYGISEDFARLEIWTEFLNPPSPSAQAQALRVESDPQLRQAKLIPDFFDETLNFGAMEIGSGRAFTLEGSSADNSAIIVGKSWIQSEGRTFLIEGIELKELAPLLGTIRRASAPARQGKAPFNPLRSGPLQAGRSFPDAPGPKAKRPLLLADRGVSGPAVVLDYQTLNSSLTNYVFEADETYLISAAVNLYGTNNVIEGGTVIKFEAAAGATIDVKGAVRTDTDMYRPAVLTARDDDSIGEGISSSSLTGVYASIALNLDYSTSSKLATLDNLRILHAGTALRFNGGNGHEVRNIQIGNSGTAVQANSSARYAMRNALGWNLTNALTGSSGCIGVWEHTTLDAVDKLRTTVTARLTNCLLTAVADTSGISGLSNLVLASSSGIYSSVGGGNYYLPIGSTNRDRGTTNINPALRDSLKSRTTFAPTVLTNITTNTSLASHITLDKTVPDLGYHYAPLDYFSGGITISSNMTLAFTNGASVGIDFATNSWGFDLRNAKFSSIGGPSNFNYLVRAHNVQETSGGNPGSRAIFYDSGGFAQRDSELRLRFTEVSQMVSDGYFLYTGIRFRTIEISHSRIYNPSFVLDTSGNGTLLCGLTNSLWERGGIQLGAGPPSGTNVIAHLRNNLIRNVGAWHFFCGSNSWTVRDNLFDSTAVTNNGSYVENSTNAHYSTYFGLTAGVGNIFLGSLSYQTNQWGKYYQPTGSSLIDAGSRSAQSAGLYHFTTTTNQSKEATSMVDIGLHYVALTSGGQPQDGDADGLPDYYEDSNGNGSADSGETDWTVFTPVFEIFFTHPAPFSILP